MSDKSTKRNLAAAVGAALAGSVILAGHAQAFENPFSAKPLAGGYMQLAANEGSCGGNKVKEGNCGENTKVKAQEGNCGENRAKPAVAKAKEGKCGEAKCGANKK